MIELKNVPRRFGDAVAVDRINLTVETGEVCVLVGSSGCGKSTTLRMINQLLPHSEGQILVDGNDVTAMNPEQLRLNMGYVIQGTGLFPHWTVARNIAMVPQLLQTRSPLNLAVRLFGRCRCRGFLRRGSRYVVRFWFRIRFRRIHPLQRVLHL